MKHHLDEEHGLHEATEGGDHTDDVTMYAPGLAAANWSFCTIGITTSTPICCRTRTLRATASSPDGGLNARFPEGVHPYVASETCPLPRARIDHSLGA